MLFSKPEYKEIMLPFRCDDNLEDLQSGTMSIEAYGTICGEPRYCYISYTLKNRNMYENGDYEQMVDLLKDSVGKSVKVILKLKKGKPKDFKIDLNSLAEAYDDERFLLLAPVGWGLNRQSIRELTGQ